MNTFPKPPQYHSIPPPGGYAVYQTPEHRARNRFFKALTLVVLGLFAWHLFMPHNYHFGQGGRGNGGSANAHEDGTSCAGAQMTLTDDDICADWAVYESSSSYPYSVHAKFNLPISSNRLFVFSQGSLAHGELKVSQGDAESDEVEVHVIAEYYIEDAISRAKVCKLNRDNNDNGVGLFTPMHGHWNHNDQIRFVVHVKLPASGSSGLEVNHFDTDLHNFRHDFAELDDSTAFKKLTLRGSNAAIQAKTLITENGVLRTSNGPIIGDFVSNTKLELVTSNALIKVSVALHNADEDTPTELLLKTSNGRLEASLGLHSTARDDSRGGVFNVEAKTSNSPLLVIHTTAPVDSLLTLDAQTSNSAAHVAMHPTFEGTFHAKTSNNAISVLGLDDDVEDPSGEGRKRIAHINSIKGKTVDGSAYWGTKKDRAGELTVTTSNSPVIIRM